MLLQLRQVGAREGLGVRVAGEQHRRHHVDPHVGGLGGEDRGREELERVLEVELAPRVRVLERQPPRHLAGPTLRGARPPRPRAVGSGGGHRSRRLRRGPAGATGSLPDVRCLEIKRQMTPTDIAEVVGSAGRRRASRRPPPARRPRLARPGRGRSPGLRRPRRLGAGARPPGGLRPGLAGQQLVGAGARRRPAPPLRDGDDRPRAPRRRRRRGGRGGRRPRPLVGVRADDRPRRPGPRGRA